MTEIPKNDVAEQNFSKDVAKRPEKILKAYHEQLTQKKEEKHDESIHKFQSDSAEEAFILKHLREQGQKTPSFGNIEFPTFFNYMQMPSGCGKYIKVGNGKKTPGFLWEVLTQHWGLSQPDMIISLVSSKLDETKKGINGKYQPPSPQVLKKIVEIATKMETWVLTDGLNQGLAEAFAHAVQSFLQRKSKKDAYDQPTFPLLAFTSLDDENVTEKLEGVHLGKNKVIIEEENPTLNPYHAAYILTCPIERKGDMDSQHKDDSYVHKEGKPNHTAKSLRDRFLEFVMTKTKQGFFNGISLSGLQVTPDLKTPVVAIKIEGNKIIIDDMCIDKVEHILFKDNKIVCIFFASFAVTFWLILIA